MPAEKAEAQCCMLQSWERSQDHLEMFGSKHQDVYRGWKGLQASLSRVG